MREGRVWRSLKWNSPNDSDSLEHVQTKFYSYQKTRVVSKIVLNRGSSAYVCLICSAKCHHFITSGIFLVNDMQTSPPPPSKRAVLIFWYKLLRIFWNKFKTKKKYSDFFFSFDQFCSQFWSIRNQYSGFWVLSQLTKSRLPPSRSVLIPLSWQMRNVLKRMKK